MINELRIKKSQMINQIEGTQKEKETQRKSINDLIDKHNTFEEKLKNHVEKQTTDQEDQFNKKMRERKDRSISRSLNKSSDQARGSKTGEDTETKKEPGKAFKLYQNNLKFGGGELDKDPLK